MKTLYLDAFSGISGDMLIGALLDLGIDFEQFKAEIAKLNVTGYQLHAERIAKSSIYGTNFDVQLTDTPKDVGFVEHHHHHDHTTAGQHHHHQNARHLSDILTLIEQSELSVTVKQHAKQVFQEIAQAEAVVHQVPVADIHFHEVGALDSIIDIVGAFVALELLGVEQVTASALTDGSGFIEVAHGKMPVPVPAVMQMRVGSAIPIKQDTSIQTELITPTGMGIVKTIVQQFTTIPNDQPINRVGYGFGKRETHQLNALRVLLYEKKN